MKTLFATLALILALAGAGRADAIPMDDLFATTRKWLAEHNLSVTGGIDGARDDSAAFGQETLLFCGEALGNPTHGNPLQREMLAKRAAVVVAQRALTEYLQGFALVGDTLVRDGVTQHDIIRSAVAGIVRGSQVVVQEYNREKDTAVAMVKLGLHGPRGFASAIYERMFSDPTIRQGLKSDRPPFKAEGGRLEESYDGLIIDATGQDFRPALINRIFAAKGDVLYDPADISRKVLTEQGCGEYSTSVEKARAALAERGVKNPLVVKACGATTAADLQVTDDDAARIYAADQNGKFLGAARVAFVLK